MKLVSWNVNGLRACLGKGFLDYCAQEDADVVCLQETKLQPEQAVFDLDGYHRYFYSAEKKGYSGTAVLTKTEPLSVCYGLGDDAHDHEAVSYTHLDVYKRQAAPWRSCPFHQLREYA